MISREKLDLVIEKIENLDKEYYGGMEVSYLENKVRESDISSNKVYNYMNKGYIKFEVVGGKKRISKEEVIKYLERVFNYKSSSIKDEFNEIFN